MSILKIDDKWSVVYDPKSNDSPMMWMRHGDRHYPFDESNAVVAMFYALKEANAALTQSRAETAAAYDLAAKLFDDGTSVTGAAIGRCIRAIATPEQTAALNMLIAEAEALAVEKTAAMVRTWRNTTPMTGEECANAIIALIGEKK